MSICSFTVTCSLLSCGLIALNRNKLEFQSDLQLMEQEGAYDAACKRVLMHKEVLAFILKYVVSEYKDYSLE